MKWLACETWGLCDFRRMVGPFEKKNHAIQAAMYALDKPDEPFRNQWSGNEIDPGDSLYIGDWLCVQDGMICGPYLSKREAKKVLAENIKEDHAGPNAPGYVGRVVKIVHRYRGNRNATVVVCAVKS